MNDMNFGPLRRELVKSNSDGASRGSLVQVPRLVFQI